MPKGDVLNSQIVHLFFYTNNEKQNVKNIHTYKGCSKSSYQFFWETVMFDIGKQNFTTTSGYSVPDSEI